MGRVSLNQCSAIHGMGKWIYKGKPLNRSVDVTNSHTNPLFLRHNLLNVYDMINFNLVLFMYEYTYGLLPTSFNGAFQKLHTHERNLNYITIVEKSSFIRSIPTSYMPKYWNSLSLEIKLSSSINTFKTALRINLQSKYNVTCSKQNCYSCS